MNKEQLIDRHAQTLKSWVGTGLAKDECIGLIKNAVDEALFLYGVSNSFICVKDQEPPRNTQLIVQDPNGGNYLTSWRESYKIFMCQNKQEDSSEWKWKQI